MKIKFIKGILLIIVFLSSSLCNAQQDTLRKYSCEEIMATGLDSILIDSISVKYKIIEKKKNILDHDQYSVYSVVIILPNFNLSSDKDTIKNIFEILFLNTGVHEIEAFKSCSSYFWYYTSLRLTPKGEEIKRKGFIGKFYLR